MNGLAKGQGCSILEQCVLGQKQLRVDRESCVIRDVKILGRHSDNGRTYTDSCLARAVPLYEGIAVNVDHPKKPTDMRSAYDRIGKLTNVRLMPDGIYGDLSLLRSHELTERVLEAAERMPDLFGLSHNADGRVVSGGKGLIVEEITEVRHVDLVADPATNKSLFESREVKKKTFKEFIQESKAPAKLKKALLEMMGDMGEDVPSMEMEGPMEGKSWKKCLVDAIGQLVEADDEDSHKKAAKIMAFLKPDSKSAPEEDPEMDTSEEDMPEEDEGEDEEDDEYMEEAKKLIRELKANVKELTEANEKLELREYVRKQCGKHRVVAKESLVESCVLMKDRSAIADHIEDISEMANQPSRKRPRSVGYGFPTTEQESNYDSFVKQVKKLKGN